MKYPKTIIDECSGVEVSSNLYKAYQEGREDTRKEIVEWLTNHMSSEDLGCLIGAKLTSIPSKDIILSAKFTLKELEALKQGKGER